VSTAEEITALKQATREAHEAIQGLREAQRDMRALLEEVRGAALESVQKRISDAVVAGLAEYDASLKEAIGKGTQATYDRFDLLATVCLGEERMRGGSVKPLAELFRRYIESGGEAQLDAMAFLERTRAAKRREGDRG
jgi:hypothetical protein